MYCRRDIRFSTRYYSIFQTTRFLGTLKITGDEYFLVRTVSHFKNSLKERNHFWEECWRSVTASLQDTRVCLSLPVLHSRKRFQDQGIDHGHLFNFSKREILNSDKKVHPSVSCFHRHEIRRSYEEEFLLSRCLSDNQVSVRKTSGSKYAKSRKFIWFWRCFSIR